MRLAGIILLVLGVILLIYGVNASQSIGSDIKKFFTGTPTNTAVWLVVGGAVSLVAGIVMAVMPSRTIGGP